MRKKYLPIMLIALLSLFTVVGCSSVAKEKEIKEDLTNYSEGDLLEKGEKLKK